MEADDYVTTLSHEPSGNLRLTAAMDFGATTALQIHKDQTRYKLTPKGRLKLNDMLACTRAAVAGLGIAILPARTVQAEIQNKRLRRVLDNYRFPNVTLYTVYPSRRWLPAKMTHFLKYLETWELS